MMDASARPPGVHLAPRAGDPLALAPGTTVVTFLMVFLIQATQNRETRALHLKIDELIRAQRHARNIFAGLEHATDEELAELETEFRKIRARAEARAAAKSRPGFRRGRRACNRAALRARAKRRRPVFVRWR